MTFSRLKSAKAVFGSLKVGGGQNVTRAKIPFSEVPTRKLPAVYFTRLGHHPIVIQDSTPMGYSIKLWDGRESVCSRLRLEKTLEPEGYFLSEHIVDKQFARRKLTSELAAEKRHIGLGLGNGAVNISLLVLFIFLLNHVFQSAFPVAEMSSLGLAVVGILASILSSFGFLQARFLISSYFDSLSDTNRAREMKMPTPFPVRNLTKPSSSRMMLEAASAPFFLAAGAIAIGYDATAVASWGVLMGCFIPGIVFLSNFPEFLDRLQQAIWFYQEKQAIFEEDIEEDEEREEIEHFPMVDDSVIRAHNLFLAHPEESRPPLIDQVSLRISKGEKVGFYGDAKGEVPIFLRLLSGLLSSDRGLVWIDGNMVDGDQTQTIGWFSERASLVEGSLRSNICLRRDVSESEIAEALEMTGLDQTQLFRREGLELCLSESGKELTDQEKMLIFLTRSLVHKPDILVFDSPRGKSRNAQFRRILQSYLARKECTLLIGANEFEQLELTDRTVILSKGKIINDGPTDQILKSLENHCMAKP